MHLPSNNPRRALLREFFENTKIRFETHNAQVSKKSVKAAPKLKVDIDLMRSIFESRTARRNEAEDDEEPMLSPRPRRDSRINELVSIFDAKSVDSSTSSASSSNGFSSDFSKLKAADIVAFHTPDSSPKTPSDRSQSGSKVERLKALFDSPSLPKKDAPPPEESPLSSSDNSSPHTPHYVNIDLSSISSALSNFVIRDTSAKDKPNVDKNLIEYDSIKENLLIDISKSIDHKRLWNFTVPRENGVVQKAEVESQYDHLKTWNHSSSKRPKEDATNGEVQRRTEGRLPLERSSPNDANNLHAIEHAAKAVLRILNQDSSDGSSSGTLTNVATPEGSMSERSLCDPRSGSPRPALKPKSKKVRHKVARRKSSNRKNIKPIPKPRTRIPPPSLHLYANLPPSRPLPPIVLNGTEPSLDDVVPLTSPSPFKGSDESKTDDEWIDFSDLEVPLILPYAVSPTLLASCEPISGEAAPYDHLTSFHPKYIGTRGVLKGQSEPNLFKNRELALNHHYERLNSGSTSSAPRQHLTLDLPPLSPEVFAPAQSPEEPRTPRTVSVATQAGDPGFERSASRKSLGRLLRSARSSKKTAPKETATFYAELSTVDATGKDGPPVGEMADAEDDGYEDVSSELPPWLREDTEPSPVFSRSPEQLLTSRSYLMAAMRTETLGPRASWCDLPEVQQSGILGAISAQELKLQESIWRLYLAQARHCRTMDQGISRCEGIKAALCSAQRALLFADLLALRDIARKLLTELEEHWEGCILMPTNVGELLHRHATLHSALYVKYCSNQRFQHRSLDKLMKEHPKVKEAVESSLGLGPLSSLLAAPAVHLTQLPRLLAKVLHWLPRNSPDHHTCRLALDAFTKLVAEGREGSRRMDKMEEMLVLSHQLEFKECRALPLISASRWLVKHGELARIEPPSPRRAFSRSTSRLSLFLFNDLLLIAKKKSEESYSVVDYCPKSELDVSTDNGLLRVTLHSHHQERPLDLVLRCSCESDRLRWLSALTKEQQASSESPPLCPEGRVRCIKNFLGQQHDELTLEVGDILHVLQSTQDGWCEGEREGATARGWFPADHTTTVHSDDELWLSRPR